MKDITITDSQADEIYDIISSYSQLVINTDSRCECGRVVCRALLSSEVFHDLVEASRAVKYLESEIDELKSKLALSEQVEVSSEKVRPYWRKDS